VGAEELEPLRKKSILIFAGARSRRVKGELAENACRIQARDRSAPRSTAQHQCLSSSRHNPSSALAMSSNQQQGGQRRVQARVITVAEFARTMGVTWISRCASRHTNPRFPRVITDADRAALIPTVFAVLADVQTLRTGGTVVQRVPGAPRQPRAPATDATRTLQTATPVQTAAAPQAQAAANEIVNTITRLDEQMDIYENADLQVCLTWATCIPPHHSTVPQHRMKLSQTSPSPRSTLPPTRCNLTRRLLFPALRMRLHMRSSSGSSRTSSPGSTRSSVTPAGRTCRVGVLLFQPKRNGPEGRAGPRSGGASRTGTLRGSRGMSKFASRAVRL